MSPLARSALCAAFMLCTAIVAAHLRPNFSSVDSDRVDLESRIPNAFAGWEVDPSIAPIAADPELQAGVERLYAEVLARTYTNKLGQRVMLSVAYGGKRPRALQVHRPEGCYASQGFSISNRTLRTIDLANRTINAMSLVATRERRIESVTYWIRLGDKVVAGWAMQTGVRMKYGLRREIPDELLFRVSTVGEETHLGFQTQQNFLRDIISAVNRDVQQILIGGGG